MMHNQIKKSTKQEPFDPIAICLYAEKRKMPSPVGPPSDWRTVPADDVNDDGFTGKWVELADPDLYDDMSVMLYLRGGGYFFCSPCTHRPITIDFATHTRARVCVPDCRLTPEHLFPAPVENALFTYYMLVTQGVSPSRIVAAGDSADGGLALALLVALRNTVDPLPADAVLYSPWTDLTATGQGLIDNDKSDVMPRDAWMAHGAALYLGDSGAPADHPLALPLYADFMGLSTLYYYVSTSEALRDDTLRVAERTQAAGISASVGMGRRLPHVWSVFYPFLPEARVTLKRSGEQIRRPIAAQRKDRELVKLIPT